MLLSLPPGKIEWPLDAEPLVRGVEARIAAALEEPCDLDFADRPLYDVIAELAEQHHVPIQIDRHALEDTGAGAATITRTLRGVTLKAALQLLLGGLDLAYEYTTRYITTEIPSSLVSAAGRAVG